MKVTLVTEFFYPTTGGTQTVVACIAGELARRGHDVAIFAPLANDQRQPPWENKEYRVVWAPFPQRPIIGYLTAQYNIWRLMDKDVDVVHVFHPAFGLAGLMVRYLHHVQLVVSLMGYDTYDFERMPYLKQRITLAACQGADVVTAPSRDLASLARKTGVSQDIITIPHGIAPVSPNPHRVVSLRRSLGIGDETTVFIAVQRHYPVKEPMVFLEAWQHLGRSDCHLILVGGGELEPLLRQWVQELGLTNVTLVGEVSRQEVPFYLALADAFIHHSRYESFGLGVLEAMQARLPVIACNVGAIPEIITDGVEGLLIPPSDPIAMAAAAARLADSSQLRARMSAAAYKRSREFAWGRLVDQYEQIYRSGM
jgi:glycosyltransferase involved in cell wall biosynthesis